MLNLYNDKIYVEEDYYQEQIKKGRFVSPRRLKKMTVEQAYDYLDLASMGHGELFIDYYDFLHTLIVKCNVDPNFVLSDEFEKSTIKEIKNNILNCNIEDSIEIIKRIEEYKNIKIRNEVIIDASSRYEKLRGLRKLLVTLKEGKPITKNFDLKTTKEINNMYRFKK